ncbi:MAG: DUF429 domain-containing protein, partial [Deltaproteobacteria bacterium]|nr:DUF429 domain-containing protein [Deltaproteobacteria bacterium]
MARFSTYIGIDLGGARGKTTAVAVLSAGNDGQAMVESIDSRHSGEPWTDAVLASFLEAEASEAPTIVAIDAPLTEPSCARCTLPVCPGQEQCSVEAVRWLCTRGVELQEAAAAAPDRIVAIPTSHHTTTGSVVDLPYAAPLAAYTHRCTELHLHFELGVLGRDFVGRSTGPLAARAGHLRRVLAGKGFALNDNLIEVSPRATVGALFGERKARGYKRDADPWLRRARIIEDLAGELGFAARSRMSREEVLRNDHCFEAL